MTPGASQGRDTRFLDPALLARLGSMELKARTVVEGFIAGLHRSPYHGFSVEFAEYRQYLPGDDLSTLDWKVFARSDRHYVKKFEEETNLEGHLLVDVSASMTYRGGGGAMSKLDYAGVLAGSLAYLMNRQRDAVGLIAFDDAIRLRIGGGARRGDLHRILIALEQLEGGHRSHLARPLQQVAQAITKRGLVIVLSDLLDDRESVVRGLTQLRFRGTDVIVFQILDPHELRFPFERAARFRDPETGEEVTADPARVRASYLDALDGLRGYYARELRGAGIDFLTLDTSQPLDAALVAYLDARSRRH
ncbi:MAG TPA: DUF58 domain-containing protein [Vicinamibacterales bacterium]|jgi:uncharacterized protein (DUF58 family)|nr:DUF58 domain-containing protein [Vicinamibacterales bacterium]